MTIPIGDFNKRSWSILIPERLSAILAVFAKLGVLSEGAGKEVVREPYTIGMCQTESICCTVILRTNVRISRRNS